MTRRLRSIWLGVALVGALTAPASVVATPPDLVDHYKLSANRWGLHQLHPTARRTLVNSLLFGVNPALTLVPTEKMLDLPSDHPQPPAGEFALNDLPIRGTASSEWDLVPSVCQTECGWVFGDGSYRLSLIDWRVRQCSPAPEENDGYMRETLSTEDFAYVAFNEPPIDQSETVSLPAMEALAMPAENAETTCPYLRQQMIDRNVCQLADPEMNRAVLDNLKSLEKADKLLELAKEQASAGRIGSALKNCLRIQELCPGSPCAERAYQSMLQWVFGEVEPASDAEEAAEPEVNSFMESSDSDRPVWEGCRNLLELARKAAACSDSDQKEADEEPSDGGCKRVWFGDDVSTDEPEGRTCQPAEASNKKDAESIPAQPNRECVLRSRECEPGIQEQVCGMMKACHLLLNQGMYHQAAALAQQAFALDPQRVMADPLIAQMRLLDESMNLPGTHHESNEPPTCPYCAMGGKPIREIVQEPKKTDEQSATLVPSLPPIDAGVVPALDQELTEATKAESILAGAEEMAEALLEKVGLSVPDVHSDADGALRVFGECCVGGNVYHLRFERGSLNVWKTPDASKSN